MSQACHTSPSGAVCARPTGSLAHFTAEHQGVHPVRGTELRWPVTGDDLTAWSAAPTA